MRPLDSCQSAAASEFISEFREFTLSREDEAGVIFISCGALPTVFIAVNGENDIRDAIGTCLSNAFSENGLRADVFTNGSVAGPTIHTVVKLTK